MLATLVNGVRRVLGLLSDVDADMADVEERLDDLEARVESAIERFHALGESIVAVAPEPKRTSANGRNGKAASRRRTVRK